MQKVHLVTRTDVEFHGPAFAQKGDAEQWIVDYVVPNYRKQWRTEAIDVFESMAEYKNDRK